MKLKTLAALVGLLMALSSLSGAFAQEAKNCDGGIMTVTGKLSKHKIIHEGMGEAIDCFVLQLREPAQFQCDFLGGLKTLTEIQVVPGDKMSNYKEVANISDGTSVLVYGKLVPGETAWYCREVGLSAISVVIYPDGTFEQESKGAAVAPAATSAAQPVMWDCQCACRCPEKGKPYELESPGQLCEPRKKDPRLVAEETESICLDLANIECKSSRCHCEGCKAYDAPCGE